MRLLVTGGSGFIGTNLIEAFESVADEIVNVSRDPPLREDHRKYWTQDDILDAEAMAGIFAEARPDTVIHLAARTDCVEDTTPEQGYGVNIEGTANVLDAVAAAGTVKRLIVTSSQFVCRAGHLPKSDTDFNPETVYGESKALSEKLTRERDPDCIWTIVRPTNVWGPYHQRYADEFWKVLAKGWYFQPGYPTPTRCYAYVGNVIWQMKKVLEAPPEKVHRKVFYLGDRPIDIIQWIEGFHREITGREKMRVVPGWLIKLAARGGDAISAVTGRPFYITSSRLRSMTTDYATPIEPTFEAFGEPPHSLEDGIRATVKWFRASR